MNRMPGVYDAKVVAPQNGKTMLLIPQAFGDVAVPAAGQIGACLPGTRGYVSFISGEVEYPVWIGAAT